MKIGPTLLALAFAAVLASQDLSEPEGFPNVGDPCCLAGGLPRTAEQMLERRGVQVTTRGLLGALDDPQAVVRSLAARSLADGGQRDSIPAIFAAFSVERALGTREIMAYALAMLGDGRGVAALRDMCTADFSASLRTSAAEDMLGMNHDDCVDDLLEVLRSVKSSSSLASRRRDGFVRAALIDLDVLPLDHASERQVREIRELAVSCLASDSNDLRMAASEALGKFGDAASARELQAAITAEADKDTRAHMLSDLRRINDRLRGPGSDHN